MSEENIKIVYDKLCASYLGIDTFRAQLLGLLPLATGGGIFLLYKNGVYDAAETGILGPLGVFGAIITLGLFAYEIFGIKKCGALIASGTKMEAQVGIDGQFSSRPGDAFGFVNEPFASGVIYSAVLAAWAFVGSSVYLPAFGSRFLAAGIFTGSFCVSLLYFFLQKRNGEAGSLIRINQEILQAEEAGDPAAIAKLISQDFSIVRASGLRQERQAFLVDVPKNKDRGRREDKVRVEMLGQSAVYICRVTTNRDENGKESIGHFWNIRQFVRVESKWNCASWRVVKL